MSTQTGYMMMCHTQHTSSDYNIYARRWPALVAHADTGTLPLLRHAMSSSYRDFELEDSSMLTATDTATPWAWRAAVLEQVSAQSMP